VTVDFPEGRLEADDAGGMKLVLEFKTREQINNFIRYLVEYRDGSFGRPPQAPGKRVTPFRR
jgi:hypothetical protein